MVGKHQQLGRGRGIPAISKELIYDIIETNGMMIPFTRA
jgi:hypothetical protein